MSKSEEAAVAQAHELLGVEASETEEVEASGSEAEEIADLEFPEFSVELPADLAAELAAEPETAYVPEEDEEFSELVQEWGEDNNELIARALKAEKKAEYLEGLRVKEAKKNWAEEAKQFFPLAEPFLDEFNATSRRGYLRQAKAVHDRMIPIVEEKVLKPARDVIAKAKTDAAAETKDEMREAWGQPITQHPPSEATVTTEVRNARRRRGEFSDYVREMVFKKPEETA